MQLKVIIKLLSIALTETYREGSKAKHKHIDNLGALIPEQAKQVRLVLKVQISEDVITNITGMPVIILDGKEIMGAKQNRMINATILVSADKTTEIPVGCVERGRWRYYSSNQFDKSDTFGYSSLRHQKSEQVHFSLQAQRGFSANQGAIWAEIDRQKCPHWYKLSHICPARQL